MRTKTAKITAIAAAAAIAVAGLATAQGWAHGPGRATGPNAGQGMGYGMMQGGQGQGMGYGMMQGGQGLGYGAMAKGAVGENCFGAAAKDLELTTDQVTKMLTERLAMHGNDRLKVGKVVQTDDDTIVAEIVTVDDSLVRTLTIDRDTGMHRPAK